MNVKEFASKLRHAQTLVFEHIDVGAVIPVDYAPVGNVRSSLFRPEWAAPVNDQSITLIAQIPANAGGMIIIDSCIVPPSIAMMRGNAASAASVDQTNAIIYGYPGQQNAVDYHIGLPGPDFNVTADGALPPIAIMVMPWPMPTRVAITLPSSLYVSTFSFYADLERPVLPLSVTGATSKLNGYVIDAASIPGIAGGWERAPNAVAKLGSLLFPATPLTVGPEIKASIILGTDLYNDGHGQFLTLPSLTPALAWPNLTGDNLLGHCIMARPFRMGIGIPAVTLA